MITKCLVILGPTSTGKTDIALSLAKKFDGEIIACDSRQVYRGLDIGTGKMPGRDVGVIRGEGYWILDGVKVWMYDLIEPTEQYDVARYVEDVGRVLDDLNKRGKLPIIVGGTGFYLKVLTEGISNLEVPVDIELRKSLSELPLGELQKKLQTISPNKWDQLNESDRANPRRLIRALELVSNTEGLINKQTKAVLAGWSILRIGLTAPREVLYDRINVRVIKRVGSGMLDEARSLVRSGMTLDRMKELGLEYRALAELLGGEITSEDEFIRILQGRIRGYARRQLTWFKREQDVEWFDVSKPEFEEKIEKKAGFWYDQS